MKITKRGTPPDERTWTGGCKNCGSEAEAKQSEMTHITRDWEGSFSWEKCPVCGAGDEATGYGGMIFHPDKRRVL